MITCPSSKSLRCKNEQGCYEVSEQCDGFKDCSDESDELNCPYNSICAYNELFTCNDGYKICISRVCDEVKDCCDGSDEGERCSIYSSDSEKDDHFKNIYLKIQGHGRVFFSWVYGDSSSEFNVTVQSVLSFSDFQQPKYYNSQNGSRTQGRY
ncbi:Low-density lipoprotein receptor-related protein 5 [Thelohanellus kitauei]|uniref:Low-density lipoprotein receptor-related protein 5 n=1 Tax=Thelohanellus kitauei TaxID=669202 RepID=A0A0C2N4U5_THEKT|nr:Low-density lipoprotein receptor-related protein 5 [Thelohanellus kitauei]